MLDFNDKQLVLVRDGKNDFLSDDVSIMIAYNKKTGARMSVVDLLVFTNLNILPDFTDIPLEVISFLDPTIESIQFEKISEKSIIHLKFREKQEFLLNNIVEIERYLSSGTIKGIVTFTMVREILRENRDLLDKISEYLLEKETIFGDEFFKFVYEKYPELKEKREEEKKSRELEINKKYTEACADTAEELHDKKVAQEVIEAVEQEEENIIKEAEESKSEVLLDMDKEDK